MPTTTRTTTVVPSLKTDLIVPTTIRRGVGRRQRPGTGTCSRPGTGSAVSPDGGKAIPALVADNPFLHRERTLMPLQGLDGPSSVCADPPPVVRVAYSTPFVYDLLRSYQGLHHPYCVTVIVTRGVGSSVGRNDPVAGSSDEPPPPLPGCESRHRAVPSGSLPTQPPAPPPP